jgi:hypothetical protein
MGRQLVFLFVLAIPIASVTWTMTHEEMFREPREWCVKKSRSCQRLFSRKVFYVFTCEYCLSHWVTAFFLFVTRYHLLFDDWRGYLIAGFSLVWIANVYMSFFGRLRMQIREDRIEIAAAESRDPSEVRDPVAAPAATSGPTPPVSNAPREMPPRIASM